MLWVTPRFTSILMMELLRLVSTVDSDMCSTPRNISYQMIYYSQTKNEM